MTFKMSSAQVLFLVQLAVLHAFVQADSVQATTTTTKPEVEPTKTELKTGSADHVSQSADSLTEQIARYIKDWETYYNLAKSQRAPRTKRWAEYNKRPGYYNTYSSYNPSSSYTRYRYPSNLMALLRGTKRGWEDQPATSQRWRYPSNLMVLLRGKKSMEEDPVVDDEEIEEEDEELSPLEKEALAEVMKRLAEGWRNFLDNYSQDISEKRSAFYGYDAPGRNTISRRPFGARQFMVWNGGRYILG